MTAYADQVEMLRRASKRAGWLSLLGLLVIGGSIGGSLTQLRALQEQLRETEQRVTEASERLRAADEERRSVERRRDELKAEVESLEQQWKVASLELSKVRAFSGNLSETLVRDAPLSAVVVPQAAARRIDGDTFDFSLWLEIPQERNGEIARVDYVLNHPSFGKNNTLTSTEPEGGFRVSYRGWGALDRVIIRLHLRSGDPDELVFNHYEALEQPDIPMKGGPDLPPRGIAPGRKSEG